MANSNLANQYSGLFFTLQLPGGRVARIPQEVVEQHIVADARACHGAPAKAPGAAPQREGGRQGKTTTITAGDKMITINIYAGQGEVAIVEHGASDDVVAHSLSVDAATGMSEWHSDWEYGECEYTDESGFPQRIQAWHRHPFGTEYTEIYEG
jgi:hypothetical protein